MMILTSILSIASLGAQEISTDRFLNTTIWQALRELARSSDRQFIGMAAALQTPCNDWLRSQLDNPQLTFTLFAPVDEAFISFFPERTPLRYIRCFGDETCDRDALQPFLGTQFSPVQIQGCLSELVKCHVVPNVQFVALSDLKNVSMAVTVLPTMLNSTSAPDFVKLADGISQSIIVNQTEAGARVNQWINTGAHKPARIVRKNIQCLNGVIQGVSKIMVPPFDAFRTVQYLSPRSVIHALRTPEQAAAVTSLSNITMFWPVSGWDFGSPEEAASRSKAQLWNHTEYILPDRVLFNNQTKGSLQANTISGKERTVTFGDNFSMTVDGIPVVHSNILMENGVLHLIQSPFPPEQRTGK